MKAIIVEIKGRHAAVLSDDGVVSKVKNKNYIVGQEIVLRNNNKLIRMAASAAAAIMIFVTPAWAYLTPYSYVSLDVNPSFEFFINRFDRVLTVKAVNDGGKELLRNINIDGLKNKEIQDALRNVLNELKNQGYIIKGEEDGVIVATSSKTQDKTDILSQKIQAVVNEEIDINQDSEDIETKTKTKIKESSDGITKSEKQDSEKHSEIQETDTKDKSETIGETEDFTYDKKPENFGKPEKSEKAENSDKPVKPEKPESSDKSENSDKSDKKDNPEKSDKPEKSHIEQSKIQKEKSNINIIEVSKKEVDEAKKLGVTPGKLNLVEKLQDAAESAGHKINSEDWLNSSVQEINAKIKEYKEELKQKEDNKNNNKSNNKKAPTDKDTEKGNNKYKQKSSDGQ